MDYVSDSESSESGSSDSDYPCPFCDSDFFSQKEVIEHMKICSETDPESDRNKPICLYCKETFETTDEIEEHIGIH